MVYMPTLPLRHGLNSLDIPFEFPVKHLVSNSAGIVVSPTYHSVTASLHILSS